MFEAATEEEARNKLETQRWRPPLISFVFQLCLLKVLDHFHLFLRHFAAGDPS